MIGVLFWVLFTLLMLWVPYWLITSMRRDRLDTLAEARLVLWSYHDLTALPCKRPAWSIMPHYVILHHGVCNCGKGMQLLITYKDFTNFH